jgi:hypothetical protein
MVGMYAIQEGFNQVLSFFLGGIEGGWNGNLVLIKFLVFVLILAMTKFSLERTPFGFKDNKSVVTIISIAVSLIAVRYLTTSALINFIWLPYGVLGVVLATILPFILYFFFIESFDESIIRKVGWITFCVIYVGLAYLRWDDFSGEKFNLAWMYVIIAVLSLLAIIFDKQIRYRLFIAMARKGEHIKNAVFRAEVEEEIKKIESAINHHRIAGHNKDADMLEKEKKRLRDILANRD